MFKMLFVVALSFFIGLSATAQKPDSNFKHHDFQITTAREFEILLKNGYEDMGLVAEKNGYPSAGMAIGHSKEIDLSPIQLASLRKINEGLKSKMKEMVVFMKRNEAVLDSLFRTNKLNDGVIIFYTNRFGLYQGELRNAILQAAFKNRQLLSPQQNTKLQALKNHN